MSDTLITIPIQDLTLGMFVENVFDNRGHLLFCSHILISNSIQIDLLRKKGASVLAIDCERGNSPYISTLEHEPIDTADYSAEFTDYKKKLRQAYFARRKTVEAVRSMMVAVKSGRYFSVSSIVNTVEGLMTQVLDKSSICMGLFQIKSHSDYLYAHSVNVSVLMMGLASILGYSRESIIEAGVAGIFHDIGMVRIPEELVHKQSKFTGQEFEQLKSHPQLGVEIALQLNKEMSKTVCRVISEHHERFSGGGYPLQLKGEFIHELSIMCALADVYDKLTSNGMNHKPCLPQEALALIFQGADLEYPRRIVEFFTKLLGIYPVGSFVKLESGEMGIVIKINREKLLAPQLFMLFDTGGTRLARPYLRNLSELKQEKDRELWRISSSIDPSAFAINPAEFIFSSVNS
jgi:putative nucleotidyltransferase with HDIG domain